MAQATMGFPPDFKWGITIPSIQLGGENQDDDWWQNIEQDLDQAAKMGINAYRLFVEWGRIEPEPSVIDKDALDQYRQMLQAMLARGIEPMVTLHHFYNPLWLLEKGDWNSGVAVDYFKRFTEQVVRGLGDLVTHWITFNEPMQYLLIRSIVKSSTLSQQAEYGASRRAMFHLLQAHAAAYYTIKELFPSSNVGVAKNIALFEPKNAGNPLAKWWNRRVAWLFNDAWMGSMATGRLKLPSIKRQIKGLAGSFDFIDISYGNRFYSKFPSVSKLIANDLGDKVMVGDENYSGLEPAGIFQIIKQSLRWGVPIYITENSEPDRDDELRSRWLVTHLRELWRAISFNYLVMGYSYQSLDDSLQSRQLPESDKLYKEICHSTSLSIDMVQRYAPDLIPELFPSLDIIV